MVEPPTSIIQQPQNDFNQNLIQILEARNKEVDSLKQQLFNEQKKNETHQNSIKELVQENQEIRTLKEIEMTELANENLKIKDKLIQFNIKKTVEKKIFEVEAERNQLLNFGVFDFD